MIRGISFWEKKEGLKQIYLFGNPFTWIVSLLGVLIYAIMWVLDRFLLHRGVYDFGPNLRRWWDRSLGFLLITWFMHYIPFFIMGRMLFLHHYLPAFIRSVILTCTLIDFLGRQPQNPNMTKILQMSKWQTGQGTLAFHSFSILVIGLAIGVYVFFMPLTYGTGFDSLHALRSRKWFKSWDLQHS
jgi:dolichyl-phosphate-mannose-protein mannosyltransferase